MNLSDIEMSVRLYLLLQNNNINTLEELLNLSDDDLIRMRNLGRRGLEEILEIKKKYK